MAEYCDSFDFSENNQDHYDFIPNETDSFQFWQGLRGPYFTPSVDEDGVLSWTNNGQLPNPEPVRIVGKDGRGITLTGQCETVAELPEDPDQGEAWAVGEEEPFECYAWFGEWVDMGLLFPAGQDGVSPTVTMTAITGGTRLTITDKDHPGGQSADIMNGSPGNPGQDGVSPAVSMEAITGGTRLTITDKDHPSGQSTDIMNGAPGQGVPAGGTAGQVLQKSSSTDYATEWHSPNAGDPSYSDQTAYAAGTVGAALTEHGTAIGNLKSDIGIVEDGNTCTHSGGISEGQYVIWKGQLFIASTAIAEGATLASGTNLTPKTEGGLNDLRNTLGDIKSVSIESQISALITDWVSLRQCGSIAILDGYMYCNSSISLTKDTTKMFLIKGAKPKNNITFAVRASSDGSYQFAAVLKTDGYLYMDQPASKNIQGFFTWDPVAYFTDL